jgi:predicted ATPase
VEVRLLRQPAVVGSAGTVTGGRLSSRRSRLLLAALALANRPLPADALADVLWPVDRPATWDVALRGAVRALRQSLLDAGSEASDLVRHTPAGYLLADGTTVDVLCLADRLHAVRTSRQADATAALEEIAGCRGDHLLPSDEGAWLETHRRRVDEVALSATELLVNAATDGELSRALTAARRAAEEFPLDERAHRVLLRGLGRAGDRAALVTAFERCRTLLGEQLGVDPSPQTVTAYLDALGDQSPSRSSGTPTWSGSFVGRQSELGAAVEALRQPGLVTVTGPGGVGKSRLAAAVMSSTDVRSRHPGGAAWVSLSTVGDDRLVAAAVARELGAASSVVDVEAVVVAELAPRGPFLLVLDACEQVVDGAASLIEALRAGCPLLRVVAASRVPLSVHGEQVVAVAGLGGSADAPGSLACELMQDRVRDAGGELRIDDSTRPLVDALLARCGGLPLAIELVAAQLADLSAADLLDHLGVTTEEPLAALVLSSYDLLDDEAALLFRRLSVLGGAVTLPIIRAVVTDERVAPVRVVRILRELTVRGLVAVDRSGARWLYRQNDEVRRVATDLLTAAGEQPAAFARLGAMLRSVLPDDPRSAPSSYQADLTTTFGPLRSYLGAALDGLADADLALEIAFRIHRYWAATSVSEGRFWLSRLLAMQRESPWRGFAEYALGYLGYWAGDTSAGAELSAGIDSLRGIADDYVARALVFLGGLDDDADQGALAVERVREAIELSRPYAVDLQVSASMGLACLLAERGDPSAEGYAADAVSLCRSGGSDEQLAATLPTAAMSCWQVGALPAAVGYVTEARKLLGDTPRIARVVMMSVAAGLALADGDAELAARTAQLADDEATAIGVGREVTLIRCLHARALLELGDLPGARQVCVAAFDAASRLTVVSPLANCLETAALLVPAVAPELVGAASVIRERGQRPTPAPLAMEVDAARMEAAWPRASGGTGIPAAVDLARRELLRAAARPADPDRPESLQGVR